MKFKFYKQLDVMDCGPTCLKMISEFYGKTYSIQSIREKSFISKEGVSMYGIGQAAEKLGFRTMSAKVNGETLLTKAPLPCIIHWNQNHFVVVIGTVIHKVRNEVTAVKVADPAIGIITYTLNEFFQKWERSGENGIVMLLQPTPSFYESVDEGEAKNVSFKYLIKYLRPYRKLVIQLLLGLIVGSLIQLIFPFLTRALVDYGINKNNLQFIYLILFAQLMLFTGRVSTEFIRNWILLHISTRINLSILSDFLIKLMNLPLSFFDVKKHGDILQRIRDHSYIEAFLTNSTLNMLFSVLNMLVFGIVLCYYSVTIFLVFLFGSALYGVWVLLFIQQRRNLNFKRFDILSKEQSSLFSLISGMQDIKLANAEMQKRWSWEKLRLILFDVNVKIMTSSQYQQIGGLFVNEGKNIIITFLAAKYVLEGDLSLGTMLSIQYIIGQLNSPVEQLIQFSQSAQDAKISIERLNEVYAIRGDDWQTGKELKEVPHQKLISINNLRFNYPGSNQLSKPVLNDINLEIAEGTLTAIVGVSGSGKTTLLKLLLKFYLPTAGKILIDGHDLQSINNSAWRSECGVVMQDGFIFSESIANNIALGDENPDEKRLAEATRISNIDEFINSLPLGLDTLIGAEGNGISQGQKQRILIARAVYKNPKVLFLDEATNSLDANNEKEIMKNFQTFFKNRTVIVVAHRLSTVKDADKIIVLDKGEITEIGTHDSLVKKAGKYFELIKNQLELGN
jgi:ATP-binding cassette subfamily B protein